MEQQPQLNDHNKQEYPPMHIYDLNTSLTKQLYNNELYHIPHKYNLNTMPRMPF